MYIVVKLVLILRVNVIIFIRVCVCVCVCVCVLVCTIHRSGGKDRAGTGCSRGERLKRVARGWTSAYFEGCGSGNE